MIGRLKSAAFVDTDCTMGVTATMQRSKKRQFIGFPSSGVRLTPCQLLTHNSGFSWRLAALALS